MSALSHSSSRIKAVTTLSLGLALKAPQEQLPEHKESQNTCWFLWKNMIKLFWNVL